MALIDLKNCTIRMQDGYTGPDADGGAVNLMAGYMAGAVTMTVDLFAGAVNTGDTFTVAGEAISGPLPVHTITAHTETSSNTTSITFIPALTGTVADDAVITIQPHSIDIRIGEGNLTYSEKIKYKYILDRGRLWKVRREDDEPVDVRLDYAWEWLRSQNNTDPPTVEEAFKKIGNASNWVSTSSDPCEPYCIDIVVINAPPCIGYKTEVITLSMFRYEDLAHDPKTSQVAVTGKCNILQPSITRV